MMRTGRTIVGAVAGVALLAVAYIGYRAFWLPSPASWPADAFSPATWRAAPPSQRFRYWKALQDSGALDGKTRDSIVELLGDPDSRTDRYVTYVVKDRDPREFTFNLVYVLQVDFDGDGRVSRALIRSD